jgi:hypothetical protein
MIGRVMADTSLERLKLLYDYEKFHIGLYGAMITGFIAILSVWGKEFHWSLKLVLALAIVSLLVAAICGAVLASSVIDIYDTHKHWGIGGNSEADLTSFWTTKLGPYNVKLWKAHEWWRVGHTAFWLAVILVVGAFLVRLMVEFIGRDATCLQNTPIR